jgi:hypothetical protein
MRHRLITPLLLALLLPGCPSHPEPELREAPPPPAAPHSAAPATPPPPPAPPPPPPVPTAAAAPTDALDGFAGFSRDGKSFAWIAPSALDPATRFLKKITEGADDPKLASADRDEASVKEGLKTLAKDGYTRARGPVPPGVTLDANLTATPPTAAVVQGAHRIALSVGKYPYPPTDMAELWGTSADGKHLAIYIHGRDVPGVFSKGEGGEFHFYFVVAVP